MGKHRVYEIAKELGKTNQEVIDILAKNNIQVKSTLSTVDDTVRDLVVKNSARKPVQEKKAAPAPQHIVKKEPVKVGKKVGRNDPCPCGSGKKYKHCCGR